MQSTVQSTIYLCGSRRRYLLIAGCALSIFLLAGCASNPHNGPAYDPIEKANRGMYWFNSKLDKFLLKPLSDGYIAIVPKQGRQLVSNVFDNALYVDTILNDFLQGKGAQGASDVGRFTVNSTIGIGGVIRSGHIHGHGKT